MQHLLLREQLARTLGTVLCKRRRTPAECARKQRAAASSQRQREGWPPSSPPLPLFPPGALTTTPLTPARRLLSAASPARSAQAVLVLHGRLSSVQRAARGFHNICISTPARAAALIAGLTTHPLRTHPPPPPRSAALPSACLALDLSRTRSRRRIGEFDSIEAFPAAAGHCSTPEPPPHALSRLAAQP